MLSDLGLYSAAHLYRYKSRYIASQDHRDTGAPTRAVCKGSPFHHTRVAKNACREVISWLYALFDEGR
jgi:hypothetical protein